MRHIRVIALPLLLCLCIPAAAQLNDGNMDALTVGTAPDNDVYAGAWGFPPEYVAVVDELNPGMVSIVATNSFDPGAAGNSLSLDFFDPNALWNLHLPNVMTTSIAEAPGLIVTVQFDIYVVTGNAGGSVYIGGDHGGGGFSNVSDRGPQVSWFSDGTVNWTMTGGVNTVLTTFSFNTWQRMRLEIDMEHDNYDAFYGPRAGPLVQVGTDLTYRSILLDHIDRFSFADFAAFANPGRSYIDNVSVTVPVACPGDLNGDHAVGLSDLTILLAHFGTPSGAMPGDGDLNGDGDVDLSDLTSFLANFGTTCVFAGPSHEPARPTHPHGDTTDVTGP